MTAARKSLGWALTVTAVVLSVPVLPLFGLVMLIADAGLKLRGAEIAWRPREVL